MAERQASVQEIRDHYRQEGYVVRIERKFRTGRVLFREGRGNSWLIGRWVEDHTYDEDTKQVRIRDLPTTPADADGRG